MKITTLAVAAAIVLMLAAPSMAGTVLYGIQGRRGSQQLIRADLTAGTFTVIAPIPNLHTLTFTGVPGNAVPLPAAAWLGLGLLGLLGAARRQRRLRRLSRLP